MSAASINLDTNTPTEYILPSLTSSSANILRKQLVEIAPNSQVDYSPLTSNIIKFNVSSSSDIMIGVESYIRCEIYRDDAVSAYTNRCSLAPPGLMALIKSVEIRAVGSGAMLESRKYSNLEAALMSYINDSAESIRQQGWIHGDSLHDQVGYMSPYTKGMYLIPSAITGVDTEAYVTATDDTFPWAQHVGAGSVVFIQDAALARGEIHTVSSVSIEGDPLTTRINLVPAVTGAYAAGSKLFVLHQGAAEVYPERLKALSATTEATAQMLVMALPSRLLQLDMPLFLFPNGLEVSLELEFAERAIKTGCTPLGSATSPSYVIHNPRFMAMMSTPEPSIMRDFTNRWNSEQGLIYYVPQYVVRQVNGSSSGEIDITVSTNVGARSVRTAYAVVMDGTISNSVGTLAKCNDSLTTWLRSYIKSYQLRVGPHEFPLRNVEPGYPSGDSSRVRETAHHIWMSRPDLSTSFRFNPIDLEEGSYYSNAATSARGSDATKFIMPFNLSRSNLTGSILTGIDLSLVPVQLVLRRSSAYSAVGQPVYTMIFYYDSFVVFSSRNITVLN